MHPPVEIRDRSEYKERVNALLALDPARTVVLTVDMQRNYLDMEIGADPLEPDEAERVLGHSRELLSFARAESIPVIHAYVARRSIEVERGFAARPLGAVARQNNLSDSVRGIIPCMPDRLLGSPQAEIPASLVDPSDLHVATKKSLDSFLGTDLDVLLQRVLKPEAVVLAGINTDTCVYCTAFGVSNRGYKPIVIAECVASTRGKDHHWMALELMSRSFAWVITVEQFKEKIRQGRRR